MPENEPIFELARRPQDIKELRQSLSLTQYEFGMLMYASEKEVADWESGDGVMHAAIWAYLLCRLKIIELTYPQIAERK